MMLIWTDNLQSKNISALLENLVKERSGVKTPLRLAKSGLESNTL
tara:strand:- start:144 stop:278 length:135 start_codon:yes stop_codon:yes gene_type:complete